MTTPCCHEGHVHDQVFRGRSRVIVVIRPDRIVFSHRGTRLFRMRAGSALPLKHVWMMEHRPPTRWSVGFIRLEHVRGTYYRRRYWYFLTTGQVAARLPHTITFAWRHRAVYEALFAALSEIYVLRYPKKKESP